MDDKKIYYFLIGLCALLSLICKEDNSDNHNYSSYKDNYKSSNKSYSNSFSSKSSNNSSVEITSKKSSYSSSYDLYDVGYDSIMENDEYDDWLYDNDLDYANGVDDAIDDYYDEFGEDWD